MRLYFIEPEVAGGIGEHTVYEGPKNVTYLHYEFEGWMGDHILTTHPCFIVTDALASTMIASGLTGFTFAQVEISKSELFLELHGDMQLPPFRRLLLNGRVDIKGDQYYNWSGDDFSINQKYQLIVTERALDVLKMHQLQYCDIHLLIQG